MNEAAPLSRREFLGQAGLGVLALNAAGVATYGAAPEADYKVREIENVWIPMPDGVRLAARLWLPELKPRERVPAIFEYLPYHKRDLNRTDDDSRHPYWASHGYACVRVDIRGSGDSEGLPLDEYSQQEQDDGEVILNWIASQPWCTGAIGMVGISWGGINSLQMAARHPKPLKAIITHCSMDDRYANDAHYKGGCVIHDMLDWGAMFLSFQGSPGDPAIGGEAGWRDRWRARLDSVELNLRTWLRHPARDAFWKHASINEQYDAIRCPVYAIGGWVDPYSHSIFSMLKNLKVPRKGLVGPWCHVFPHEGEPGPAIDYLNESLRWWDHWLKGRPTGIMDEPMLRVWMQDDAPIAGATEVAGRWVAEDVWPSPRTQERVWYLNGEGLREQPGPEAALELAPRQTVGVAGGNWCGFIMATDLPLDQQIDDGRSLCFDSRPLEKDFEILGAPIVELPIAVDRPVAYLCARLNEVLPGGASHRVSYTVLNLCQRDSDERPAPLEPGRRYAVRLTLNTAGHRFKAGSRLRVALSTAYWPLILPSPEAVRLTAYAGTGQLRLPVRPPRDADAGLKPFAAAFGPPPQYDIKRQIAPMHVIESQVVAGRERIHHSWSTPTVYLRATDTTVSWDADVHYDIADADPEGAHCETRTVTTLARGGWQPRIETVTGCTTRREHFELDVSLIAYDGQEMIFRRDWRERIARVLV
jgi:uncharacterized protein